MQWLVGLNSLRLLAMALIVVYHFWRSFLPGGFIAVDIFFGISGFLITTKLVREFMARRRIDYGAFIKERIARLFPSIALMVVIVLSLALFVSSDVLTGLPLRSLAALGFFTNILELATGGGYENAISPNLFEHTWFVALEMQFLLLLPIFVSGFLRQFKKPRQGLKVLAILFVVLGIGSVALQIFYASLGMYDRAYFALDTHFAAFAFAGAFAILNYLVPRTPRTHKIIPTFGLILALLTIIILAFKVNYSSFVAFAFALPFTAFLTPLMIFCIIKLQKNQNARSKTLRAIKICDFLGGYTFGIYLFHYPLFLLAGYALPSGLPSWSYSVITLLASIALTALSTIFLQKVSRMREFRRARVRKERWRGFALVSGAVCVMLLVLSIVRLATVNAESSITAQLASQREEKITIAENAPEYLRAEDFTVSAKDILLPALETARTSAPTRVTTAAPTGRTIDGASVLMIGDSVMLGAKNNIEQLIAGAYVDAEESRGIETAARIIESYKSQGKLPQTIVISLITNERYISATTFDRILAAAGDGHDFILMTGYAGPTQPRDSQNAVVRDYAASHANVRLVDWYSVAVGNWSFMYADHIHLNIEGRGVYANLLKNALEAM